MGLRWAGWKAREHDDKQASAAAKVMPLHPAHHGPKPKISDADLLVAIRADLENSPFVGEGHRKV